MACQPFASSTFFLELKHTIQAIAIEVRGSMTMSLMVCF